MNPTLTAIAVFVCAFGGALAGIKLRNVLPEHHLDSESKDTVKVGIALVATMTALVLGLVTSTAKSSFDRNSLATKRAAADLLSLDRTLDQYGPEADEIRKALVRLIADRITYIWERQSGSAQLEPKNATESEQLSARVRALEPQTDDQRWLQTRARDFSEKLLEGRWLVFASQSASVHVVFLAILVCWLTITFTSFGLFAPRNVTVLAVLFVCALSVAGAVFLILELDGPFEGLVVVSSDPMRYALAHLNR